MRIQDRDQIARRMEAIAEAGGEVEDIYGEEAGAPRWSISTKWIEFECGCRAERIERFFAAPESWEPVVFQGTPQVAVYESVCFFHGPSMNKRIGLGAPGLTFEQWRRSRRGVLMGKVRP